MLYIGMEELLQVRQAIYAQHVDMCVRLRQSCCACGAPLPEVPVGIITLGDVMEELLQVRQALHAEFSCLYGGIEFRQF
jgi:Na+-translocating ferredoxin:NAD+ oxidoreductase RNF subunit RnfB